MKSDEWWYHVTHAKYYWDDIIVWQIAPIHTQFVVKCAIVTVICQDHYNFCLLASLWSGLNYLCPNSKFEFYWTYSKYFLNVFTMIEISRLITKQCRVKVIFGGQLYQTIEDALAELHSITYICAPVILKRSGCMTYRIWVVWVDSVWLVECYQWQSRYDYVFDD